MLKKTILYSLATCSLLFGDYYSSVDARLEGSKSLRFEDGVVINVQNNSLSIDSKYDLNYLLDAKDAKQYEPTIFTTQEEVDNPVQKQEGEDDYQDTIIVSKEISYNSYNFTYILQNNIYDKKFVLKTSHGMMIVEVSTDNTKRNLPLFAQKQRVTKYKYIVTQAFDKNGKTMGIKEDEILTKFIDQNGGLVAVEFLDDGVKNILKVKDAKLQEFLDEKASRVVTVDKFDFQKDKLYLSFINNTSSSSKRLNITYEMKKKNIKTVLKSPLSLFDPESKSSQIEQNVAILRNYKNQELYEIKKVQLIDGKSDVSWLNHPKKKVVVVEYMTSGVKDKSVLSKSKGQQFYGIEGLFYLASWMDANSIKSKVFTYINGSLPFDATMKLTKPHHYEMQKGEQTIFSFTINKDGFVQKMQYPSYDMVLNLETIENDTTLENKDFLKNFKQQNNIKLIKE